MGAQGTAIVDFGTGAFEASTTITGQSGITGSSLADAWVWPVATADNTADTHTFEQLEAWAEGVSAGSGFTVKCRCKNGRAFGKYTIAWVWN